MAQLRQPEPHSKERVFIRLTLFQRIQHWLLLGSFVLLAVTGLPMRFPEVQWLGTVYVTVGGLQMARIIHRVAAVVMIVDGLIHLVYIFALLARNKFNVRAAWPMIPNAKDARDWWDTTKYYVGVAEKLPEYDRFNFREKFDYFAVFWGLPVMMLSGLVLWFPVFFGNRLPDLALGMAYIAHSDEAILAISAIVVWHFYNVHYNPDQFPMSWIWWHGKISEEEVKLEHPLEYRRLTGAGIPSHEASATARRGAQ